MEKCNFKYVSLTQEHFKPNNLIFENLNYFTNFPDHITLYFIEDCLIAYEQFYINELNNGGIKMICKFETVFGKYTLNNFNEDLSFVFSSRSEIDNRHILIKKEILKILKKHLPKIIDNLIVLRCTTFSLMKNSLNEESFEEFLKI